RKPPPPPPPKPALPPRSAPPPSHAHAREACPTGERCRRKSRTPRRARIRRAPPVRAPQGRSSSSSFAAWRARLRVPRFFPGPHRTSLRAASRECRPVRPVDPQPENPGYAASTHIRCRDCQGQRSDASVSGGHKVEPALLLLFLFG